MSKKSAVPCIGADGTVVTGPRLISNKVEFKWSVDPLDVVVASPTLIKTQKIQVPVYIGSGCPTNWTFYLKRSSHLDEIFLCCRLEEYPAGRTILAQFSVKVKFESSKGTGHHSFPLESEMREVSLRWQKTCRCEIITYNRKWAHGAPLVGAVNFQGSVSFEITLTAYANPVEQPKVNFQDKLDASKDVKAYSRLTSNTGCCLQ